MILFLFSFQIELSHKQIHKSKIFRNFSLPPKNVLKCFYIIEILSAHLFDYDNLYVEFNIELPYGFVSSSPLKGVTQTAQTKGPEKDAHFGHVFELCVNYQMDLVYEEGKFELKYYVRTTTLNSCTGRKFIPTFTEQHHHCWVFKL